MLERVYGPDGPGAGAPDAKSRAREYSHENFTGRRLVASHRRRFATYAFAAEMHRADSSDSYINWHIGKVCERYSRGCKNDDAITIASKPNEDVFAVETPSNVQVINHECWRVEKNSEVVIRQFVSLICSEF